MAFLGTHVSIAGGLHLAIERGDKLGCEAIQVFTQSSRTWVSSGPKEEDVILFRKAFKSAKSVQRVVAHNSYLLNLSTSNEDLRKKSVRYFIDNMERCEAFGIESLITHPGSHLGAGVSTGIRLTSKSIDEVLKACPGYRTRLVLENTAGQGDCLGCHFEELAEIVQGTSHPDRIFFCFDTQHAFAAGYDLRTDQGYQAVIEKWDAQIGTDRIVAFHLNDALKELGCRVDRHANIGKGFLGKETFRPLVNDARFLGVPMCLETDPGEEDKNWKREIKLLKSLREKSISA